MTRSTMLLTEVMPQFVSKGFSVRSKGLEPATEIIHRNHERIADLRTVKIYIAAPADILSRLQASPDCVMVQLLALEIEMGCFQLKETSRLRRGVILIYEIDDVPSRYQARGIDDEINPTRTVGIEDRSICKHLPDLPERSGNRRYSAIHDVHLHKNDFSIRIGP